MNIYFNLMSEMNNLKKSFLIQLHNKYQFIKILSIELDIYIDLYIITFPSGHVYVPIPFYLLFYHYPTYLELVEY